MIDMGYATISDVENGLGNDGDHVRYMTLLKWISSPGGYGICTSNTRYTPNMIDTMILYDDYDSLRWIIQHTNIYVDVSYVATAAARSGRSDVILWPCIATSSKVWWNGVLGNTSNVGVVKAIISLGIDGIKWPYMATKAIHNGNIDILTAIVSMSMIDLSDTLYDLLMEGRTDIAHLIPYTYVYVNHHMPMNSII